MLESTPTGTRENGPYDMWDKCLEQSATIELKYEDGKHLAPNGLPSELPELYAKIVRTPAFLDWFGDWTQRDKTNVSKVVYKSTGEPMLVFHGTRHIKPVQEGLRPQKSNVAFLDNVIYFSSNLVPPTSAMRDTGYLFNAFIKIINPIYSNKLGPLNPVLDSLKSDGQINGELYEFVVISSEQVMQMPSTIENKPSI